MTRRSRVGAGLAVVVLALAAVSAVAPLSGAQSAGSGAVSVTIGDVDVSPANPTTGTQVLVTPSINNSGSASGSARVNEVTLRGDGLLATEDSLGRLGAGDSIDVPLSSTFTEPGDHQLSVHVRGLNPDGSVFYVQRSVYVTVDDRSSDVGVSARTTATNGSTDIQATITQYGTIPIKSGELQVVSNGRIVERAPVANVSESDSANVTFDGASIPSGELVIRGEYTLDDEHSTHTTNTTLTYQPQRSADVALTGIEASGGGTTYTISGDAANLGSADAASVRVNAVGDGLSANGGYFVGKIETSEFATFDMTVQADSAVDEIPITVNYSADGQRYSDVVTVDVSGASSGSATPPERAPGQQQNRAPSPSNGASGGGLPLFKIGGAVAVIAIVVVVVRRWRNP
ncbi:COG1361 S-layer family protein [Halobacterium salinarum]|uniref:CARDB domain-containing protein n=1 Tax=Halobacterium salinarum TaxID=2242 RepID=UPI002552CC87|nr:COG1361 S-layer family protein [Halobacterium salinarum]MDL0131010.1 COG1361 S-layer family protein [Halobacterium salinarum]